MTDTAPKTPGDVFTRVLTENIGKVVHYREMHDTSRHTQGRVRAVEAGVVTFASLPLGLTTFLDQDGPEEESLTYYRIDALAYITPSTIFD